jgi:hypothetical protein
VSDTFPNPRISLLLAGGSAIAVFLLGNGVRQRSMAGDGLGITHAAKSERRGQLEIVKLTGVDKFATQLSLSCHSSDNLRYILAFYGLVRIVRSQK